MSIREFSTLIRPNDIPVYLIYSLMYCFRISEVASMAYYGSNDGQITYGADGRVHYYSDSALNGVRLMEEFITTVTQL